MGKEEFNKIINVAKSADELDRVDKQHKRMKVYIDDFEDLVDTKIFKQFHQDNYQRLYKMLATFFNILKKIVNLKSIHYKKDPVRLWIKKDGKTEDDRYTEMIEDSNVNLAFQNLNKYLNINNTSFMRILPDYDNERIKYEAVPSENIIVLRSFENPYKIDALLHKIIVNGNKKYLYWDKEIWGWIDENLNEFIGATEENKYKDPETNEGIIPYVPCWAFQPIANSFWNETINDDLYNATIQANVQLTHLNNLMKVACYKQWVFTGLIADDIKAMYNHVTDGLNPIALTGENSNGTADTITEDLEKFLPVVHDMLAQVLDQHGVEWDTQVKSAQKSSAAALTIKKEALDALREEQQPLLRNCEDQTAYYSVLISNQEFNTAIDQMGSLRLVFAKEVTELTPDEIGYYDWQVTNGYKSKKEVFMMLNPDIPEDEVDQKIQENLDYNRQFDQTQGTEEIENVFAQETEETMETA